MPQTCTICSHPSRQAIEAAIFDGATLRDVARQYATSKDAVARHKAHCIKPAVQEAKQERAKQEQVQILQTGNLALDRMARDENLIDEALRLAWDGEAKDVNLLIRLLQVSSKQIELRAKLEGDLDERSITVTAIPEWRDLRNLLLEALAQHPQAKLAVMRALEAYSA